MDGGITFQSYTTGMVPGGIFPFKGGEATATRQTLAGIPPGANRMVRLGVVISGGPLRSFGTITMRDASGNIL